MSLDEWAKLEKQHIERFVAWCKENAGEKETCPLEMLAGEWDEQFRSWAY